jgi:hypothetical protein
VPAYPVVEATVSESERTAGPMFVDTRDPPSACLLLLKSESVKRVQDDVVELLEESVEGLDEQY